MAKINCKQTLISWNGGDQVHRTQYLNFVVGHIIDVVLRGFVDGHYVEYGKYILAKIEHAIVEARSKRRIHGGIHFETIMHSECWLNLGEE